MKQGIVKFSKEFITPTGLKEWLSLEWEVGEPFDEAKAMETFIKVKEFVCNSQPKESIYAPAPSTELPVINKAEERLAILIENAETKEELMKYGNEANTPYLADMLLTKLAIIQLNTRNNGHH